MTDDDVSPHPDIDIETLHEIMRQDGGIFLGDIPKNFVLTFETRNSLYTLVVVDSEKGKVALQGNGKHLNTPEICSLLNYLFNSTFDGPSMRTDWWIGKGALLQARHALTKIFTTTEICTLTLAHDPSRVRTMINEAQKKRQRMLTLDECDEVIFVLLDNGFTAQL